ncbi:CcoQ/FixQ family Cbb3-type cytochrome c oxidase assembly chaperone [Endozoicomonas arenosclerae]|uniref:CcoQ/FixQ family Cbb3-type cytochrome c oxidase assembly chaperone n=1 Tax=Endozoicomonas arenosclerae TaxID=1633495 RepID=UPI000784BA49|nr:CcoQ/FixQ family Cbb3-type cytochrome c oxidase assembly chaperone [Endozoicomonas arenosclerae]
MDINDLRGLSTVFAMIAFLAVFFWAYSGRKKRDFDEAASLPFTDDTAHINTQDACSAINAFSGTKAEHADKDKGAI